MTDIVLWMNVFISRLNEVFGERVWFAGLQGSRARGEATDTSDIDTVVILDELTMEDIGIYNKMLDTLPDRELICGFLSGKKEILAWEPSDLFQFYYDTVPVKGSLDELLKLIDGDAVDRAIKLGVGNIYHGCVHNMLYEKSDEILKGLYKAASFTVQAIVFRQTGSYIRQLNELILCTEDGEREIIEIFISLKNGGGVDFEKMSETLFNWAKNKINTI